MPTLCHMCGRTQKSCATCAPFKGEDISQGGRPELCIHKEDEPVLPVAAAVTSADDSLMVAHITRDGTTLTLKLSELRDLPHFLSEEQTYTLRIASMSRADFEALGEFDGF